MYKTLVIDKKVFLRITISLLLVFFALIIGLSNPRIATAQAEGSCNTATGTLYGPNGTDSGTPCPGTQLSNDGIYGCQGLGAQIQNVGTRTAIGGVYVPVNDAAVTLNTGFLVYKECILDGTTRKIAENVSAEYTRNQLQAFNQGRNGGAQFVENEYVELRRQNDILVINSLNDSNIGVLCPAFKTTVRAARARAYVTQRNQPNSVFACTLPTSATSLYETLAALREPQNNPYGANLILQAQIESTIAYNEYNQRERWIRSNGVYDLVDNLDDPLGGRIVTPGYFIAQSVAQTLGSGFRQLESANEIDQVVGNLFGGLTTQLVSDTRGLIGLTQPVNGQPSYLDRMTAQTNASVRQQAANAALAVVSAARQIETSYLQAKEGIATALSSAIEQLRAAENQCWNLIIPAVETRATQGICTTNPVTNQQTCTGGGVQLNIATSTQFSQQIVDSQIAPLATSTIQDIRASEGALALLNQLVVSLTNTSSQAAQQQALLRLDTMVANRQLHTATDATNAAAQRDNVVGAVETLVTDTITAWGDSTDPNVGWCNVNNPSVIERWFNEWRQ